MTEDEIRRELSALSKVLADNTKAVNDLTVVILGKDGQGGFYRAHTRLCRDFYNFRLMAIIVFSSAGLFGGGGFWLSKIVGG